MLPMVGLSNGENIGLAPPFAMASTFVMMANSIGLLMENATVNQHNAQQVQIASVTQCCSLMIATGAAKAAG